MPDLDTIYCGDCIPWLKSLPDECAIISDPPYGIDLATDYKARGRGNLAQCNDYPKVHGDNSPFDPSPLLQFQTVVLFGANYYADKLPPSQRWLVWDKRRGIGINDQADCELIWTNQTGPARVFRHLWNGMLKDSERDQQRCHPTQKPVELISWIIETLKIPEDTVIVDPYIGSGTTAVACIRMGRHFLGCEIEPKYVEIANRRIAQALNDTALFSECE